MEPRLNLAVRKRYKSRSGQHDITIAHQEVAISDVKTVENGKGAATRKDTCVDIERYVSCCGGQVARDRQIARAGQCLSTDCGVQIQVCQIRVQFNATETTWQGDGFIRP